MTMEIPDWCSSIHHGPGRLPPLIECPHQSDSDEAESPPPLGERSNADAEVVQPDRSQAAPDPAKLEKKRCAAVLQIQAALRGALVRRHSKSKVEDSETSIA